MSFFGIRPELPIEVRGPDADRLLNVVFTRDVARTRVGRCSYQIACDDAGGMLMDGVLVRLSDDRFWYGQADGDLTQWLKAHGRGMDVEILTRTSGSSQVQGPDSLRVLEAAVDGSYPEPFRYFDAARVSIAGQDVVVTRTGFTNELGWEVYLAPGIDAPAVGERILEAGGPYGMTPVAVGGARRIEAGLAQRRVRLRRKRSRPSRRASAPWSIWTRVISSERPVCRRAIDADAPGACGSQAAWPESAGV